ncbi:MAG: dihydroorotate dehydrogenase [Clostridia bacterium]
MNNRINLNTEICGIQLENPIMAASGVFGYGYEMLEYFDINKLGAFSFKGTTVKERFGNETPRIAECSGGMLNAVGLQNPGLEKVVSEELVKLKKVYNKPLFANISGFCVEEYINLAEVLSEQDSVNAIEVNISCPNVKHGGMAFGTTANGAAEVTKAVKKVSKKPIFIKLSPNVTDITEIAKAVENEGADGISMINTLLGMRVDIYKRKPVLKNITGGLSGNAIFPIALRMIWQVYNTVKIPIIGMGGVSTAENAIEMMMCGASAVQIGAAGLVNPYVYMEIIDKLPEILNNINVHDIKDIVGAVLDK